jgi:hypothetical protein
MMTRWKAFTIHLTISATIAVGVSALMLMLWYTSIFFAAAGGRTLLILLLGVDVIIGPLITLIIFNAKKSRKMLIFDFSVIAILQIAALIYGMSVMFQSRPVYVAFTKDSFSLVTANEIDRTDLDLSSNPAFKSLPLTGPVFVYAEMPGNASEKKEVEYYMVFGKGLHLYPQYFKPYAEFSHLAGQAAKPVSALKELNGDRITEINQLIESSGRAEAELGFLPLQAKEMSWTVILDKSNGKVLKVLQMNP